MRFLYFFSWLFILLFSSCNKDKPKWDTTENGVRIYHNSDNSLISSTSITWEGDTSYFGVAHGKGIFSFQDKYHKDKNFSKKVIATYGYIGDIDNPGSFIIGDTNKEGMLNGFGVVKEGQYIYLGHAKNGKFKGEGIILLNDKLFYQGNFKNSLPQGYGKAYFPNGVIRYDGNWKKGKHDKEGTLYYENGLPCFEGNWKNGIPDGEGKLFYENGKVRYEGNWKNGKYNKNGILYYPNGREYYNGKWRDGNYSGEGILLYPNGKIFYKGKWKENEFNGFGTLYLPFDTISHVWKNGNIDKVTEEYYTLLYKNEIKFNPSYFKKLVNRAVIWERYHAWLYIAIWISGLIIILVFIYITEFTISEDPYCRIKRWTILWPYISWLILGIFGLHRSVLRSRLAYIYLACFAVAIGIETRDICHFLFWPSTWFMWDVSVVTLVAIGIIGLCLMFDLIWIPWRVYVLNRKYIMSDRYEKEIRDHLPVPLVETCEEVPVIVEKAVKKFPKYLNAVRRIHNREYEGSTGWLARAGRALIGSTKAIAFEQEKLTQLEDVREKAINLYNEFSIVSFEVNIYMEQSRITALKNLTLAKELVLKLNEYKNKDRKIEQETQDLITDIRLNDGVLNPVDNFSDQINWDADVHWDVVLNNSMANIEKVLKANLGPKATAIGAGLSLASSIVEGVGNAMKRESAIRLRASISGKKIVEQLDSLTNSIIKNESLILDRGELLEALYNANKAFVEAYVPIRDKVFGANPNVKDFFIGERALKKYANDKEMMREVHHLIRVCQEYNIINKSK